jgi:hypothetical protein
MGLWNLLKNMSDPESARSFWKVLKKLGSTEAIRESVRFSYDKHFKGAVKSKISIEGLTPHQVALWCVLAERYEIDGFKVNTANFFQDIFNQQTVLAELTPFLYLPEDEAREALVEYVIYKEYPKDANISWLTNVVQKGHKITKEKDDLYDEMMKRAKVIGVAWLSLMESR